MVGHLLKTRIKVLLQNKVMLFWTLLFPIILTTFFHFAFSNLANAETLEIIPIAVIDDNKLEQNIGFKETIASLSTGKEKLFKTQYVKTKEEAEKLLQDNQVSGYIASTDKLYIITKKNGLEATIMKTVVDTYYSKISLMENITKEGIPILEASTIIENKNVQNYLQDSSSQNMDFTVIFFYTMIGMVCMYAGFFGIDAVGETEANLSKRGARVSASPVHKGKILVIFALVGWGIQYIENLILLAYMICILGVDFGNQIGLILLLMFVGSFAGITFGTFLGAAIKKGPEIKVPIFLTLDLIFSFLAGMMMWQMKYIIATHVPILGMINPVTMITDALYSLYYYNNLTIYIENIMHLFLFGIIMLLLSYLFIRRKKYDSL